MTPPNLLSYELSKSVATITMDDGKANVISLPMLRALQGAFDRAQSEAQAVLLTGRPGIFCGGYDLTMFSSPLPQIVRTLRAGGELVHRMLSFPKPIVLACSRAHRLSTRRESSDVPVGSGLHSSGSPGVDM